MCPPLDYKPPRDPLADVALVLAALSAAIASIVVAIVVVSIW